MYSVASRTAKFLGCVRAPGSARGGGRGGHAPASVASCALWPSETCTAPGISGAAHRSPRIGGPRGRLGGSRRGPLGRPAPKGGRARGRPASCSCAPTACPAPQLPGRAPGTRGWPPCSVRPQPWPAPGSRASPRPCVAAPCPVVRTRMGRAQVSRGRVADRTACKRDFSRETSPGEVTSQSRESLPAATTSPRSHASSVRSRASRQLQSLSCLPLRCEQSRLLLLATSSDSCEGLADLTATLGSMIMSSASTVARGAGAALGRIERTYRAASIPPTVPSQTWPVSGTAFMQQTFTIHLQGTSVRSKRCGVSSSGLALAAQVEIELKSESIKESRAPSWIS
jgi:hypothetical protein